MRWAALWLVGLLWTAHGLSAQNLVRAQAWDEETSNFLFQVKQIDEFIERFNHRESTLLSEEMRRANPDLRVSRLQMIQSLFNQADPGWDPIDVRRFLRQVSDSTRPAFLGFRDRDWYATLDCAVLHLGRPQVVQLTLQVQTQHDGAVKWVIVGARGDFLALPERTDSTTSLTPFSHGTDFMKLNDALLDVQNIRNYLPQRFEADALTLFVYGIRNEQIEFSQVNRVSYHFLQVEDWVFTVHQFNRPTRNAGWLISQLAPADATAKQNYRRHVLQIR